MDRRALGATGLNVTPIGFGAFKIGRNEKIKYPSGFELPDEAAVARLLNGILDLGVNLIDTAPAYGLSEERLGAAIGHRRDEFVLSTKVGETFEDGASTYDFSARAVRASVERSLVRLRTDAVDVLLIHSDGDDRAILEASAAPETVVALRDEGLARARGFSGKTVEGAIAALAWADVVMVEYHLDDPSQAPAIDAARAAGKGVFVKKGLASGRLAPAEAIRFVLAHDGVASVVIGGLSLEHFADNVRAADG